MTDLRDPEEIYREALKQITPVTEDRPPQIIRAEVWPYPDLKRLWVRLQTSPFASYPDIALTARDPDGCVVATMFIVEARETYQSLTLHLRQLPRPSAQYQLEIELRRDEKILDTQTVSFELTFKEPEATEDE